MRTSLRTFRTGNFCRLLLAIAFLAIPAFQAACQTHEARVGANERTDAKPTNQASFADWDINRDDYLMEREFTAGFEHGHWFSDADGDKDNYLSPDEFKNGTAKLDLATKWDTNGDGRIDKSEAAKIGDKKSFRKWDQDQSGDLNEDELRVAAFDLWDANHDGRLDQDEFAMGWFNYLDTNHDHRIAAAEFEKGFKG